jgi:hypothetical protein
MKSVPLVPASRHHIHLAAIGAPTLNISVSFADEASKVLSAYRDNYSLGASAFSPKCGNMYNAQNLLIGRVSYNGRIWDAQGNPVT